jgi:predicted RNA methylase
MMSLSHASSIQKYCMRSSLPVKSENIDNWFNSDVDFHRLYPHFIRELAGMHWTPLNIARKVVRYLAPDESVKILDIGSGVGKFCLAAAHYSPHTQIYGIEQRESLVECANGANDILGLPNVSFRYGNFTQLDLRQYDHFYLYNPFFENIDRTSRIDNAILYSESLYNYYNQYLYKQLEEMPTGTKVATYCSWDEEIPPGYHLTGAEFQHLVKYWIKK